jgi:RNA polymerase sigma factor (sigma-70 family)
MMNNLAISAERRRDAFAREAQPFEAERRDSDQRWSMLMTAAQAGNRLAYDRLLREIVPYIRAIVARHHRGAEIEEVVQEVLLAVHRARQTYDPARPFRPWLAAIARRRSIDALRRAGRWRPYEIAADVAGPVFAAYPDPAAIRRDEAASAAERLGAAVIALPGPQREAIELLKLQELTLNEAARLTGRSIAALKVNTHRAIKALRRHLDAN